VLKDYIVNYGEEKEVQFIQDINCIKELLVPFTTIFSDIQKTFELINIYESNFTKISELSTEMKTFVVNFTKTYDDFERIISTFINKGQGDISLKSSIDYYSKDLLQKLSNLNDYFTMYLKSKSENDKNNTFKAFDVLS